MTVSSQGTIGPLLRANGEGFVDDDRLRHAARIVAPIERQVGAGAAGPVAEMGVAPNQPAGEPFRIRIEQELVGVEAKAALRLIGAMHAVAVDLAGHDVAEIAVPHILGALRQRDPFELAPALAVEQAKLHLLRIGGKQRKIGAPPVPAGSQRMGRTGRKPDASVPGRKKWRQAAE